MSHRSKAWMAASVAAVQGQADGGAKWGAVLRSFQLGRNRLASAGILPAAAYLGLVRGGQEEQRKQTEDSVRQAMYISCWAPS